MKVRSVAAAVVAGAAAVVLAGGALVPAGASVTVSDVGWWTASAVPPTVPDGGIGVGSDPSGVTVGALRIDVGDGVSTATLKLVEGANQVDTLASMQVCGADDTWSAAKGGAATDAPKDTCAAGSVPLEKQSDGSWTADLHQLLAGKKDTASVIVKPAANAGGFQIGFERPTVDGVALESSSGSSSSESSSSSATSSDTSSSSASSSSYSSGDTGSSSFAAPSFTGSSPVVASADAPSVAPAPSASPAPSDTNQSVQLSNESSESGSGGQFKAHVAAGLASGHHSTRGTALGLFVLALLIGAGTAAASWAKAQGMLDLAGLRERFGR